jgi:hypothetical protein
MSHNVYLTTQPAISRLSMHYRPEFGSIIFWRFYCVNFPLSTPWGTQSNYHFMFGFGRTKTELTIEDLLVIRPAASPNINVLRGGFVLRRETSQCCFQVAQLLP